MLAGGDEIFRSLRRRSSILNPRSSILFGCGFTALRVSAVHYGLPTGLHHRCSVSFYTASTSKFASIRVHSRLKPILVASLASSNLIRKRKASGSKRKASGSDLESGQLILAGSVVSVPRVAGTECRPP